MKNQPVCKVPPIRFKEFFGDWIETTLGDIFSITSAARVHKSEWQQSGVPFLRSSDVVSIFKGVENKKAFISLKLYEELSEKVGVVRVGDILVTGGGSIGVPYLVKSDDPLYFKDADLLWFKIRKSADGKFVYWFLCSDPFRKYLKSITHIGTIAHYTVEQAKGTPAKFPKNLNEQCKLGSYFGELKQLIGLHQRKHDKLVALKKAMLQKMFPQPGTSTPEIRFKGFLDEWEACPLSRIANKVTEKNIFKEYSETFTNSAEFGVVSQRDYFDKNISNARNIGGYYVVEPESFVYNSRISTLAPVGPINRNKLGRTGIVSPLYMVLKTNNVDNTFLEYFFKTNIWHPFMFFNGDTGARSDRFSIKDAIFMDLPVPYPAYEEQKKIGAYFCELDELISQHATQLKKLQQIKSACLEKMFA